MSSMTRGLLVALAGVVLLAGCGTRNPSDLINDPNTQTASPVAPAAMAVEISLPSGTENTATTDPIAIKASNGVVTNVTVTSADGKRISGNFAGERWAAERTFVPNTKYEVAVTTKNPIGETKTFTESFKTFKPKIEATFKMQYMNAEFGVGMPVMIWFDSAVSTPEQRLAIAKAATVTTIPAQVGAWGWINDRQLIWRPKDYWQPGTNVTLNAQIAGLQTGKDKWIGQDATGSFTIGPKHRSVVDMTKYTLTVFDGDQEVKEIPVTNGIDQYPTRFGVKVILDKVRVERMKSEGTDVKNEEYDIQVNWALRTTWTGEYLHAAPWSRWAHGKRNASHGCTGMSDANAQWFFDFSRIGDIVEYVGSDKRPFQQFEGLAIWNLSWADWQKLASG